MTSPWSGRTSAYAHKHGKWWKADISNVKEGVRKVWFLDAQWTKCPVEVEEQVKTIWRWQELGNDNYIYKTTIEELRSIGLSEDATEEEEEEYPYAGTPPQTDLIVLYLEQMGVGEKDEVIIHWWW